MEDSHKVLVTHAFRSSVPGIIKGGIVLDEDASVSSSIPILPTISCKPLGKDAALSLPLSLPSSPSRGAAVSDDPSCARNLEGDSSDHVMAQASKEEKDTSFCCNLSAASMENKMIPLGFSIPVEGAEKKASVGWTKLSGDVFNSASQSPVADQLPKKCLNSSQQPQMLPLSSFYPVHNIQHRETVGQQISPIPEVPAVPVTIQKPASSNFEISDPNFPPLLPSSKSVVNPLSPALPKAISDLACEAVKDKSKAHTNWASLVKDDPSYLQLSYIKPISIANEGKVRIKLPSTVAQKGAAVWKNTMVGFFLDKLPFSLVQACAQRHWGNLGLIEVLSNGNGFFFFKFSDSGRLFEALEGGPWYFGGRPIFLKVWSPCMNLSKDGCKTVPIWAHFYNVPLEYWTDEGLSYIASIVGKPLHADKMTSSLKRLSYARICIEINIEDSLPNAFDIEMEDGSVMEIHIEYNWVPKKCTVCKEFGHLSKNCKKASHQVWVPKATQITSNPHLDGDWKHVKSHGKDVLVQQASPSKVQTNCLSSARGLCSTSNSYESLQLDIDLTAVKEDNSVKEDPSRVGPIAADKDDIEDLMDDLNASHAAVLSNSKETCPNIDIEDSSPPSSTSSTPLLARKLNMIDEVEKKLGRKKKEKKKNGSSGNSRGKLSKKFT